VLAPLLTSSWGRDFAGTCKSLHVEVMRALVTSQSILSQVPAELLSSRMGGRSIIDELLSWQKSIVGWGAGFQQAPGRVRCYAAHGLGYHLSGTFTEQESRIKGQTIPISIPSSWEHGAVLSLTLAQLFDPKKFAEKQDIWTESLTTSTPNPPSPISEAG
jgi:hypothetical protein